MHDDVQHLLRHDDVQSVVLLNHVWDLQGRPFGRPSFWAARRLWRVEAGGGRAAEANGTERRGRAYAIEPGLLAAGAQAGAAQAGVDCQGFAAGYQSMMKRPG